jgi:hypothetical protein
MEMNDPEGRAERGALYATDPATYIVKYILKLNNTQAMAGALNGTVPAPQLGQNQPPVVPATPQSPIQNPQPGNTANIATSPSAGPPTGSPRVL